MQSSQFLLLNKVRFGCSSNADKQSVFLFVDLWNPFSLWRSLLKAKAGSSAPGQLVSNGCVHVCVPERQTDRMREFRDQHLQKTNTRQDS